MAEEYMKVRGKGKDENARGKMPKVERSKLKDGAQASEVFDIPTDTEKSDLGRMRYHSVGTKGYARQAFQYDY